MGFKKMKMEERIQRLREAVWQRELTPEENVELDLYLQANPRARPDWEFEYQLASAFRSMPPLEPRKGFTERVVASATEIQTQDTTRRLKGFAIDFDLIRAWRLGFGLALLIIGIGLFLWFGHRPTPGGYNGAIAVVCETAKRISIDTLADYDVILKLGSVRTLPEPDYELLQLLQ